MLKEILKIKHNLDLWKWYSKWGDLILTEERYNKAIEWSHQNEVTVVDALIDNYWC